VLDVTLKFKYTVVVEVLKLLVDPLAIVGPPNPRNVEDCEEELKLDQSVCRTARLYAPLPVVAWPITVPPLVSPDVVEARISTSQFPVSLPGVETAADMCSRAGVTIVPAGIV